MRLQTRTARSTALLVRRLAIATIATTPLLPSIALAAPAANGNATNTAPGALLAILGIAGVLAGGVGMVRGHDTSDNGKRDVARALRDDDHNGRYF